MTDFNGFGFVNDQLGHLVGDRILQDTARTLETIVPTGGFVARFGGDAFLVYVDDATQGSVVADRIRTALDNRFASERDQVEAGLAVHGCSSTAPAILTSRVSQLALASFAGDLGRALGALAEADQMARNAARLGIAAAS